MKRYLRVLIILCVFFLLSACSKNQNVTTEADTETQVTYNFLIGAVKEINTSSKVITLIGVNDNKEYKLFYTGGMNLTNKYGDIISINSVQLGDIFDVEYDDDKSTITSMCESEDAWEVKNTSSFSIDKANNTVVVANNSYKYDTSFFAIDGDEEVELSELCKEDIITARGYEGKICSINVETGHGYIKLTNYDTYFGGRISVGNRVVTEVTEDMLITVREGTYTVKIEKGNSVGYKNVVVNRGEEATLNMSDIQIAADQIGTVKIKVSPEGASIKIDGSVVDIGENQVLTYGNHKVVVSCDGYESLSEILTIDSAYIIYNVELVANDVSDDSGSSGSTQTYSTTESNTSDTTTSGKTNNKITVATPIGATVYVDSKNVGVAPISFTKASGSHIITLSKDGYATISYSIEVKDDGLDDTYSYPDLIKKQN